MIALAELRGKPGRWFWALAMLLAVVWFGPLDYRDLFHPDEGRYAEIPREMVTSGDWVTPRLDGLKYFEKPPLQYWATAAAYELFGEHRWTARLWPATLGFLGLIGVWLTGRALFGVRTGVIAALVLASSLAYVLFSQIITLDMGLAFFLSMNLGCLLLALRTEIGVVNERRWMLGAWAAAALAILSKGLVGLVLPALTLLVYGLVQRDWSFVRRMSWVPGILLFLAIAAPWFVLVQRENPEFFQFFFVHEHFERFVQEGHHRPGAWYYFIPVVLAGALPWTSVVLAAVPRAWFRAKEASHRLHVDRLLVIWATVVVVFFSLSSSKLPGYVLPVFPALALLVARWVTQAGPVRLRRHFLLYGAVAAATLLCAALLGRFAQGTRYAQEAAVYAPWLAGAGVLSVLGYLATRFALVRERWLAALVLATLCCTLAVQVTISGAQSFAARYSTRELVDAAEAGFGPMDAEAPFYSVLAYDQTLPLRLGRTVTLVGYGDELALGLRMQPDKGIGTLVEFRNLWHRNRAGYALMPLSVFDDETLVGTPMEIMARDSRYVLVRKPPASASAAFQSILR